MKIKLLVLEKIQQCFFKILTCCALLLVQVVYNIAGANGGIKLCLILKLLGKNSKKYLTSRGCFLERGFCLAITSLPFN
jgi:hypothetical protein